MLIALSIELTISYHNQKVQVKYKPYDLIWLRGIPGHLFQKQNMNITFLVHGYSLDSCTASAMQELLDGLNG